MVNSISSAPGARIINALFVMLLSAKNFDCVMLNTLLSRLLLSDSSRSGQRNIEYISIRVVGYRFRIVASSNFRQLAELNLEFGNLK